MPQPGLVVSIRVNPNDVMGVIDTLDRLGVPKQNLSFAQAVKIVLASALESFRQDGLIPRREGFEYLDMVKPFDLNNYATRAAKLKMANKLMLPPEEKPLDPRTAARLQELVFKHANNKENMEEVELAELAELIAQTQL